MSIIFSSNNNDPPKSKADGPKKQAYVERMELQPIDPQTNGPQVFYGLRYYTHIVKPNQLKTYHQQVGYWLPPNAVTWGAYWIADDLVYTADVGRGIDVLRVNRKIAAKPVVAPIRGSWLGAEPHIDGVKASSRWGWACGTMR